MTGTTIPSLIECGHGEIILFLGSTAFHFKQAIMTGITIKTGTHGMDLMFKDHRFHRLDPNDGRFRAIGIFIVFRFFLGVARGKKQNTGE